MTCQYCEKNQGQLRGRGHDGDIWLCDDCIGHVTYASYDALDALRTRPKPGMPADTLVNAVLISLSILALGLMVGKGLGWL